jgi:chromosome segregation ATPase
MDGSNSISKPKNRKAALNLVIEGYTRLDGLKRKEENLMVSKKSTQDKIERLTKVLESLESQLIEVETTKKDWESRISEILLDFNLAEAEILELQSSLVRSKLEQVRMKQQLLGKEKPQE